MSHILTFRDRVLIGEDVDLQDDIDFYTELTHGMMDAMMANVQLPPSQSIWKMFIAYDSLMRASDAVGILRALGSSFFTKCGFTEPEIMWFASLDTESQTYMDTAFRYMPQLQETLDASLVAVHPLSEELDEQEAMVNRTFCDPHLLSFFFSLVYFFY